MFKALRSLAALLAVASTAVSIGEAQASSAPSRALTGAALVLVRFETHTTAGAENAVLARASARRLSTIGRLGVTVAAVPAGREKAALQKLGASSLVAYAERDGRVRADDVTTNDPYLNTSSWQIAQPKFPAAWSMTTGSSSTIVAVLDSGVDSGHEDFGMFVTGHNFVDGGSNTTDDNGHGTAVAGIIAAQGNNGKGVAGVCWRCRIMPVKVLGADNTGTWGDVADGVIWATDHGAKVINMSLGLPTGSRSIADAVRYAEKRNVVVVASSGNENSSAPDYPAAYAGVISVGAVDETGTRYSVSNGNIPGGNWGSNYGPWVAVDAPGCANSTWPANSAHPSGQYTYFCGTSAAAPFVSGLAGLALSYVPSASATETVEAVESAAHQTSDSNSAHGLIDAPGALRAVAAMPEMSTVSFVANASSGTAPLKVRFANTSTTPGPYSWKFGDGTTSKKTSPTHVFKRPGTYTAELVAGTDGKSDSARITVSGRGGKISTRLARTAFASSRAARVKLVYRFASPSLSFAYRLERKAGTGWLVVRGIQRRGDFRGSHTVTIKQLFGSSAIAPGRYRLVLSSGGNRATVGFVVS
jgi:subtilisin family serine protease